MLDSQPVNPTFRATRQNPIVNKENLPKIDDMEGRRLDLAPKMRSTGYFWTLPKLSTCDPLSAGSQSFLEMFCFICSVSSER